MTQEPNNIEMYGFYIERTMKKIRQHLQGRFAEMGADLTVDQWVLLDLLNKQDGLSQNEIARQVYKDAPTVTRIIDLLCKKGLTRRVADEADRRRFSIVLTSEGKAKVEEVLPVVIEVREQGWGGLSATDYADLIRILNTVFDNLK